MSRVHVLNDAQKLREEYFSELSAAKTADADKTGKATAGTAAKAKPKLKKKVADDPFASDGEQPEDTKPVARKAEKAKSTSKKPPPKAKVSSKNDFASDDQTEEESGEDTRKAEVAAKKTAAKRKPVSSAKSKRTRDEDDDDDEEVEERPKKKQIQK